MTIADEARDNALHCEMVKYAYRQTRDGIVVSFVVHPNDIPAELSTSHIGARFMVALVQVGDDELPVKQPPKGIKTFTAKRDHMDWRDVQPAAQAGIRCAEPTFRAFLSENYGCSANTEESAAIMVRDICGVESRSELSTNQYARVIWHQLDKGFQAWLMKERVGA
jgi:hypothetical protein